MTTVGLPVRNLHAQLPALATGRDVVIVDTPPLETQKGIVISAMRAADLVVVPVAPTGIEVERLAAVRASLEEVASLRESGQSPVAVVLLNRTVAHATSTAVWRRTLEADGWHVLANDVRRLEAIAQAWPDLIDSKTAELFHDVASEVLDAVLTQGGQE